jgi:hypothetical protein
MGRQAIDINPFSREFGRAGGLRIETVGSFSRQ